MIIGLDVGGTHTDAVLLDAAGLVDAVKVPTDSDNLFNTVLAGIERITRGVPLSAIHRVVLSTTLTTNAIVQHKLPQVGMLVSAGPGIDPEAYRTNDHYFAVAGSIDHRGRPVDAIDADEIRRIASGLKRDGIRQAGVVGKFSVRNPQHELQIAEILKDHIDTVFLGHRISGNLNFPRRIATTYLNAAVSPLHARFFEAVANSLAARGLDLPIRILKADGGNMHLAASLQVPAQTILSGPAASIMGAIAYAPPDAETLVLDIGGTTTDMAILINGVPLLHPLGIEIGGYKTLIRSLDTCSVGLGGDSAVRLEDGRLVIGPDRLGPAMAFGGPVPTPTDALIVLDQMPGGDRAAALAGLEPLARAMGVDARAAAGRVFDTTCRNILAAAEEMLARINSKPVYTVHELWEGQRVQPGEIRVLGGPAEHFAQRIEALSDYRTRVVPGWKVANAIGAALARTTCEVIFYADTERGVAAAPQENFKGRVDAAFDLQQATAKAFELLRVKALERGANPEHLEMEVLEASQFTMVRGFYAAGRNIRIRAQVKPGLIHDYRAIVDGIAARPQAVDAAVTPLGHPGDADAACKA